MSLKQSFSDFYKGVVPSFRTLVCFFCSCELSSRFTLKRHYIEKHNDRLPENAFFRDDANICTNFDCFDCDISFSRNEHLEAHLNSTQHKLVVSSKKNTIPLANFLEKKKINNLNKENVDKNKTLKRKFSNDIESDIQNFKKLKLNLTETKRDLEKQIDFQQLDISELQKTKYSLTEQLKELHEKINNINNKIDQKNMSKQSIMSSLQTIDNLFNFFNN